MIELRTATLPDLPPGVARFAYDRAAIRSGIVHLSVGNFHRAHMAWYLDRLLALPGNEGWGITGIGLIDSPAERAKAEAFGAQDGLYTLSRFAPDGTATCQVVGAIVDYLFAPDDPEAALRRLADPATTLVTMTVTEGGYNRDPATGRYRLDAPDVRADIAAPLRPRTAFGFLAEALRRRRDAGTGPFTVQSCDNLNDNGGVAREAVVSHARALDPALADWIEARVAFPNSMVDGITPAVGPGERERLDAASGVADAIPVFSESFMDWVIEDHFCAPRPPWEQVGARIVSDVRPYELAKLHMLNASHSMLSYPARLAGITAVDEAMAEPRIRALLDQFMERDVIPTIAQPADLDLRAYKDLLLARFANPAIRDQVARLNGNGAAKLPVFLGPTLRAALAHGADHRRMAFGLACFVQYLRGEGDGGARIEPDEPALSASDRALAGDPDPAAALRMAILREIGMDDACARTVAELREAVAARGALPVLGDLLRD